MAPVGLSTPSDLLPVAGVALATTACGIKQSGRADLLLMRLDEGSRCAATFTRNAFCAAPVTLSRRHLGASPVRALLVNSGNANAGTGQRGLDDALQSCRKVADALHCEAGQVLVFSTGVIGEFLPMPCLLEGIETTAGQLHENSWLAAAEAIMTTDTVAKAVSEQVEIDGQRVTLTGIAKGSGMIHPDMATMLAFVATDADIEQSLLQVMLQRAVDSSFNAISVDGDTSTNDACVLVATGRSGVRIGENDASGALFEQALQAVCGHLARAIVRDGEGASKFVTIQVEQAQSEAEARQVAFTVAHSPLVKTALFASDPNWGRILAAVGRAGLGRLDVEKVRLFLGPVCIVEHGGVAAGYTEEQGQQVMDQDEISIRVELGRGEACTTVWTCDLSHQYVTINAEYRT